MDDARSREDLSWEQLFPLRALLRAMRLATNLRYLFLAVVGIALTELGWAALGWIGGGNFVGGSSDDSNWAALSLGPQQAADELLSPAVEFINNAGSIEILRPMVEGCFAAWQFLSEPFLAAFYPTTSASACSFFLLCGLWAVFVWSLPGIMIARGAAVSLARDERLSALQLQSFAWQKWMSVFAAPLTPLLGIGLLTIPLIVFGVLLRLSAGIVLAGLLWPLALVFALPMAVLAVGLLLGWPLMWPAIAAEGSDSFDAVSRAYAYVFHRPLLVFWYFLQAILVGVIGATLVRLFCGVLLMLAAWGMSWGAGGPPDEAVEVAALAGGVGWAGAKLIYFWTGLVAFAPWIFKFSYLWTASTAIYFALRHEVDATEFDEVYLPEEKQTPHALPPLGKDEAGVPKVED